MTCCIDGMYCAETVLQEIAEQQNIQSPLIPRIATGLCSGMSRTNGPCGAMTGGILALNVVLGRDNTDQGVERNYAAVQELVEQFGQAHGSTQCHELLACDLNTAEGQKKYRDQGLAQHCAEYADSAIKMVKQILQSA
ncbi:MAG: C-GCAxxG-C-C family protein [Gammaproteobacteria bacterium]|nr:C-GCAxxG-C-C family protein [Gammaproteobacteria bacterium]